MEGKNEVQNLGIPSILREIQKILYEDTGEGGKERDKQVIHVVFVLQTLENEDTHHDADENRTNPV